MSDPSSTWYQTPPAGASSGALAMPGPPNWFLVQLKATRWYTYVFIIVVLVLAGIVAYKVHTG
jgi:hypothetical protein